MRIPRLDRYLALEIVGPFAAALLFLFGLLLTMQLLRGVDVLLGSGVRPLDLARILGYLAPHFLAMAMPVSFLFALILAVGRWSEDREVLALAASGVAPWRLWVAPLAMALLVASVGVWLGQGPSSKVSATSFGRAAVTVDGTVATTCAVSSSIFPEMSPTRTRRVPRSPGRAMPGFSAGATNSALNRVGSVTSCPGTTFNQSRWRTR